MKKLIAILIASATTLLADESLERKYSFITPCKINPDRFVYFSTNAFSFPEVVVKGQMDSNNHYTNIVITETFKGTIQIGDKFYRIAPIVSTNMILKEI